MKFRIKNSRKIVLTCFIICLNTVFSFAQNKLTIEIQDLRSDKGQILLALFNENEEKIGGEYGKIENKKCIIIFENISKGNYAFRYFHDENNNDELDLNWLGIPKEGYGFSNNAVIKFGPPSFEEWLFPINENIKMICLPRY